MTQEFDKKNKLIQYLSYTRDREASKPLDEMDTDLIEACVELLLELQNKEVTLSAEQIEERVRSLPWPEQTGSHSSSQTSKPKRVSKKKILLIAAIVAILCAVFAILSTSYDSDDMHKIVKDKLGSVFNLPVGESFVHGNSELVYTGVGDYYSSTKDFLENEDYDVLLPVALPEGIELTKIMVVEKQNDITLSFSSCVTAFNIALNEEIPQATIENTDEIKDLNGLQCYVNHVDETNLTQIYFVHKGNYYLVGGTDEQILLEIIENLEEKQ